jgi:hypothetical protein
MFFQKVIIIWYQISGMFYEYKNCGPNKPQQTRNLGTSGWAYVSF